MPENQSRDALGRRKRLKPVSTGKQVTPQPRDLLWFEKLAEHGPIPSSFLLEFGMCTHKSEKRGKERLTDLFNEDNTPHGGPYLTRPPHQFRTIDSRYNQLVYDIAPAAKSALAKQGSTIRSARSGPWVHSFMVSCITASIELACQARADLHYISQSRVLARANAELRWPTEICDPDTGATYTKDLISDAVFGIEYLSDYGSRFRFFALEADRATEPICSGAFHRKSFVRHLLQYEDYIERGGYRDHFDLSAPMLVLNVTTSHVRVDRMLELAAETYPGGNSYQLFQAWEAFGPTFCPPEPNTSLLRHDWDRPAHSPLNLAVTI